MTGIFFSKHFGLISLAGLSLETFFFFFKKSSFLSFRFISISLHFLFHLLSSFSLLFSQKNEINHQRRTAMHHAIH